MDPFESIRVALEALSANKLRSGLTMLGIVIGVGAVIALMSIGSGAQAAIAQNIKSLGANLITITPGAQHSGGVSQGNGSAPTLTHRRCHRHRRSEQRAGRGSGLAGAEPRLQRAARLQRPKLLDQDQRRHARLRGRSRTFTPRSAPGSPQDDMTAKAKVVMLGANVAQQLFGGTDPTGQDVSIRVGRPVQLHVAGVLQSKGGGPLANVDDQVLMPLTTLQRQFANPRNPQGLVQRQHRSSSQADSSKEHRRRPSTQITQLLLHAPQGQRRPTSSCRRRTTRWRRRPAPPRC